MLSIKKVQVVPLDENYGKIIDSFNTTDDKTKNAPSLNAVEQLGNTNYKLKGDFAILTGSLTMANGTANTTLSYPTGFDKDNCVIISVMFNNTIDDELGTTLFTYGYYPTILGNTQGAIGKSISLVASGITVNIINPNEGNHSSGSNTFEYKIVLMKL